MAESPQSNRPPATTPKASLREVERRRSERLLLTMPIRVEGIDRNGEKFTEETRTLMINREGGRIYLKQRVAAGGLLLITPLLLGNRSSRFRVVGPIEPVSPEGGELGVECLESEKEVWGIGFPPPHSEGACAALLECRRCQAVKLMNLSLLEHEVLGTSGLLAKECEDCKRLTSWSYHQTGLNAAGEEVEAVLPSRTGSDGRRTRDRRLHQRVALQLPIRVRGFYGAEEVTRSENVSRSGICFITARRYEVGEILLVTCPYGEGGQNIEGRAQVVRRQELQGTGRWIYGVCYER